MVTGEALERMERRKRTRMRVHWTLSFARSGSAEIVEATTHNLSSDGFYCFANTIFVPGEIRECTLGIPAHHPDTGDRVMPVRCRVRVIRVEAMGKSGLYGVGFRIEDYKFNSENGYAVIPVESRRSATY